MRGRQGRVPLCPIGQARHARHQGEIAMLRFTSIVRLAAVFSMLLAAMGAASAQDYPNRPIRFVVGYPAGGTTDILARIIGQYLSERLGQPIIIENKPGAGNNIGTEFVVRAPADGYTLLLVNPANAINTTLYEKPPSISTKNSAPVVGRTRWPNVRGSHPPWPARPSPKFLVMPKQIPA